MLYKVHFMPNALNHCVGRTCASQTFYLIEQDNGLMSEIHGSMDNIMAISRLFEKTDPKDSIYATLGLIHRPTCEIGQHTSLLRVDYTRSLPDILRDGTRYALSQNGNLRIFRLLYLSEDQPQRESISPWQRFTSWTIRIDVLQDPKDRTSILPSVFDVFHGLKLPCKLLDTSQGHNVLLCGGKTVDRVSQTTDVCKSKYWDTSEGFETWIVTAKHPLHNVIDDSSQGAPPRSLKAMAFVLCAGASHNGARASPEDLSTIIEFLESIATNQDESPPNVNDPDTSFVRDRLEKVWRTARFCWHRRFFVTHGGRLGLGPRTMTPEDLVVVLRGRGMPFIVRKVDDHHELVGEAYVHGIMDGEAVDAHEARNVSEEIFAFH